MIFQVEFSHPGWQTWIFPEALVEIVEVGFDASHTYAGEGRQIGHDLNARKLIFGGTTASIPPTAEIQKLIVERLLLINTPGAKHVGGLERPIVGIGGRGRIFTGSGNEMRQHL